jgi:isopenicillin N synthase-like dioxygenase
MRVKVCSLTDQDFDTKFQKSLIETGFAVVTNHSLDYGLIREAQYAWRSFFLSDDPYKLAYKNSVDPNMGYTALGGEKAVGAQVADIKQFFHWKPWQSLPPEVDHITVSLYEVLEGSISRKLLNALKGIGGNLDYSEVCQNSSNTLLRALYYPALNTCKSQEGAVRAAEHEDINFLTLLVAASAPGLQVLDSQGNWLDVPFEENSIIVNIGDSLQLASGGKLKSTTHRVVNPENIDTDRVSIPLFVHPRPDTILVPGVTAQQFLAQRLNEIYKGGYK